MLGKTIVYNTYHGEMRIAEITRVEFLEGLNKELYFGVSPHGNQVALTMDEIDEVLD